jgi:hypothetical protein
MASAYTGQGSRGYAADPKVVAAATLIYTATVGGLPVPSAPTAMKTTNLFTEAECANESKQRNVRRTAKKMKEAADAAAAAAAAAAAPAAAATSKRSSSSAGSKSNKKKKQSGKKSRSTTKTSNSTVTPPPAGIKNATAAPKAYVKTTQQVIQQKAADKKQQQQYDEAFIEGTTMWAAEKAKPEGEGMTSQQVADKMKEDHGVEIPASSLRDAVNKGRAGQSNLKRGPKGKITEAEFHTIAEAVLTLTTLRQASGESELDSVAIKDLLRDLLKGTDKAGMDIDALYKRYRDEVAIFVTANTVSHVELRRQLWTSDTNLNVWFDSFKKFVVDMGFALDEPEYNGEGLLVSEVTFPEDQKRRIVNLDETRITADGADGTPGGRPPHTLTVRHIPSTGTGMHKSADGGTLIAGSNAAGEVLPPHLQYSTKAKSTERMAIDTRWIDGMPYGRGQFGHKEVKDHPPTFGMNEKGGMNSQELWNYFVQNVFPLFPDAADVAGKRVLIKIDGGPGRLDSHLLVQLRLRGFYLFPSVPNTTAVSQETDQNYGPFKSALRRNLIVLCREMVTDGGAGKSLGRICWPVLIHGREATEDKVGLPSPFEIAFSKAANLSAWSKVGAVPLNRNCIRNSRVRREVDDTVSTYREGEIEVSVFDRDPASWDMLLLEERNRQCIRSLIEIGYDTNGANKLKGSAPRRPVTCPGEATEAGSEERIRTLASISQTHGSHFHATGGGALNGDDMIRAMELREQQGQRNANAAAAAKDRAAFQRQQDAEELLQLNIADEDLTGPQLDKLIKWKMGSGFSKYTGLKVVPKRAKWLELKALPDPPRVNDPDADGDDGDGEIAVPSIEETALGRARNDAVLAAASAILAGGTEEQLQQLKEALRVREAELSLQREAEAAEAAAAEVESDTDEAAAAGTAAAAAVPPPPQLVAEPVVAAAAAAAASAAPHAHALHAAATGADGSDGDEQ